MVSGIAKYDLFPKYSKSGSLVQTPLGGIVTLLALGLMALLFFSELMAYMLPEPRLSIALDNSSPTDTMQVNFDFAFHEIPCKSLMLDIADVSGTFSVNAKDHKVFRQPLNATQISSLEEMDRLARSTVHGTPTCPPSRHHATHTYTRARAHACAARSPPSLERSGPRWGLGRTRVL